MGVLGLVLWPKRHTPHTAYALVLSYAVDTIYVSCSVYYSYCHGVVLYGLRILRIFDFVVNTHCLMCAHLWRASLPCEHLTACPVCTSYAECSETYTLCCFRVSLLFCPRARYGLVAVHTVRLRGVLSWIWQGLRLYTCSFGWAYKPRSTLCVHTIPLYGVHRS